MKYNNQCEGTHYETPAIHTMEILSEGTFLQGSGFDKYSEWNDGGIEDKFNDLGSF